jgi:hypothetical protein
LRICVVAWKFLSARQTSVLGRDSLELLDKRMGWRVAEHIDGTVVENFNAPAYREI